MRVGEDGRWSEEWRTIMIRFHASDGAVRAIRYLPDGERTLVTTGTRSDGTRVSIWQIRTETEMVRHQTQDRLVAVSQDTQNIAMLDAFNNLSVRDPVTF